MSTIGAEHSGHGWVAVSDEVYRGGRALVVYRHGRHAQWDLYPLPFRLYLHMRSGYGRRSAVTRS